MLRSFLNPRCYHLPPISLSSLSYYQPFPGVLTSVTCDRREHRGGGASQSAPRDVGKSSMLVLQKTVDNNFNDEDLFVGLKLLPTMVNSLVQWQPRGARV